jgi:hypothetical protein
MQTSDFCTSAFNPKGGGAISNDFLRDMKLVCLEVVFFRILAFRIY